ncbi:hypothetical protein [Rhodococcus sp. PvR099]|uniref:hypothetical protein n=1 Tax=Rhodococcus sp. PvR099 TaxID=2806602 RepID=UPI001AE27CE7|nr:hypothetical protein [Rhodococcus sp. PvR099]MBP1158616.1 hypothetical protein [Rhodococcus sp. PvR099]
MAANDPLSCPSPRRKTPDEQAVDVIRWEESCALVDRLRGDISEGFPKLSQFTRDLHLFMLVLELHLGDEWVGANADIATSSRDVRPGPGGKYLRRSGDLDVPTLAEHYQRLGELARRLFEFRNEDFYETLRDNLMHRDLEGAAFEADVVRWLVRLPVLIDLRRERGTKGDDYDIDLWLRIPDLKLSIEVKTRAEDCPYAKNRLLNTLRQARKQLPKGGMGAIFMKLPTSWSSDPSYLGEVDGVLAGFFRNTTRVHAVVMVWDDFTFSGPAGKSWMWEPGHAVYRSPTIDSVIDEMLGHYERMWAQPVDLAAPRAPF